MQAKKTKRKITLAISWELFYLTLSLRKVKQNETCVATIGKNIFWEKGKMETISFYLIPHWWFPISTVHRPVLEDAEAPFLPVFLSFHACVLRIKEAKRFCSLLSAPHLASYRWEGGSQKEGIPPTVSPYNIPAKSTGIHWMESRDTNT